MRLFREGSRAIDSISGPLVFVNKIKGAGFGELVTVETGREVRIGQVLQVDGEICLIQLFESTVDIGPGKSVVWIERDIFRMPVGLSLIGRILNGHGEPIDGGPPVENCAEGELPVTGLPINPVRRLAPHAYLETGISAIDLMNTLIRGQKLPIFSGAGLPASRIAVQIARQARVPGEESRFVVIFAATGVTWREASYFLNAFRDTGALYHGVFFINLASDSPVERLLTPRLALTVAEHLALEKGYNVLVILTDMLHYCEALREVSAAREEAPGRRGYPGYMYSDLASIYERAGCVKGSEGSITQLPILTMPDDDMTHPVVDLSGYITEGQIVLDRGLHERGIFPPIDVLPSLSRLMGKGIGKGKTDPIHGAMADSLYAAYARSRELRRLKMIVGEEGLTTLEKEYLSFGDRFEGEFINQGETYRPLEESINVAWQCLEALPPTELYRFPAEATQRRRGRTVG